MQGGERVVAFGDDVAVGDLVQVTSSFTEELLHVGVEEELRKDDVGRSRVKDGVYLVVLNVLSVELGEAIVVAEGSKSETLAVSCPEQIVLQADVD